MSRGNKEEEEEEKEEEGIGEEKEGKKEEEEQTTNQNQQKPKTENSERLYSIHDLNPLVGIVMGSDSDLPIMKETADILNFFKIPFEIKIVSAHRTPLEMFDYAKNVQQRGIKVVVAGAGGSAHLPGMIASITPLPVIGVPIKTQSNSMNGLDSLLSIVQMPPGIPVATVAINGAKNAGILACSMLSIGMPELIPLVIQYKENMKEKVLSKNKKLANIGYSGYLNEKF